MLELDIYTFVCYNGHCPYRRQILGYSEILGDTAPPASRPIARRAGPRPGRSEPGSRRSMHSRSPGSPGQALIPADEALHEAKIRSWNDSAHGRHMVDVNLCVE